MDKYTYELIVVGRGATLSPWVQDQEFQQVFAHIHNHTLVDMYRLYELWTLAKQSYKVDGHILEIGVWKGGSGALLCKAVESLGKHVYLADTFQGVVKCSSEDRYYSGGEHADTSIDVVTSLLSTVGVSNATLLQGIFPDDTKDDIDDPHFALVHIDVDVYQSAKDCVEWCLPRLSVGGCLVFDDYGFPTCTGVTTYCHELLDHPELLFLYNLNGHAVFVKIPPLINQPRISTA